MEEGCLFCRGCNILLLRPSDLCFFHNSNSVHLIIKHEKWLQEFDTTTIKFKNKSWILKESKKFSKYKVFCSDKVSGIGNICPIGPEGEDVFCFDVKEVTLLRACKSWKEIENKYPKIEQRTPENFYGPAIPIIETISSKPKNQVPVRMSKGDETCNSIRELTELFPRSYQVELFLEALQGNTIIVLPTGSGKTLVSAMLIKRMIQLNPGKKAVFLVTTIPLVFQQGEFIADQTHLSVGKYYGENWKQSYRKTLNILDVLVFTAQLFVDRLNDRTLDMEDICLIVMDEAHNCSQKHPFNQAMKDYYFKTPQEMKPLVLAMTASPVLGNSPEKIQEGLNTLSKNLNARVCSPLQDFCVNELNFFISFPDPICLEIEPNEHEVEMNETICQYLQSLHPIIEEKLGENLLNGINVEEDQYLGYLRGLCMINGISNDARNLLTHALKIYGSLGINSILGPDACGKELRDYFENLRGSESDHKKILINQYDRSPLKLKVSQDRHSDVGSARTKQLILKLKEEYNKGSDSPRIICFVRTRIEAEKLAELLQKDEIIESLSPSMFVGHRGDKGMKAEEQQELISKFREGEVQLLVATSVLEEGLDVPACNMCICFHGICSVRQLIQIRGRARHQTSQFVVLSNSKFPDIRRLLKLDSIMRTTIQKMMKRYKTNRDNNNKRYIDILEEWISSVSKNRLELSLQTCCITAKDLPPDRELIQRIFGGPVKRYHTLENGNLVLEIETNDHPLQLFSKISSVDYCDCWFQWDHPDCKTNVHSIKIEHIYLGSFWDKKQFCSAWRLYQPSKLEFSSQALRFEIGKLTVELDFQNIDSFVLIEPSLNKHSLMFIPTKCAPEIFIAETMRWAITDSKDEPCFASVSVYCFVFLLDLEGMLQLHAALQKCNVEIYYKLSSFVHVSAISRPNLSLPFDLQYKLECLESQFGRYKFSDTFYRKFTQEDSLPTVDMLEQLAQDLRSNCFADTTLLLLEENEYVQSELIENHVRIKTVIITPTKKLVMEEVLIPFNRMLLQFGAQNFIRVEFRDEYTQLLNCDSPYWRSRMELVFKRGIRICDIHYHFVGNSSSSLKNHSFWFLNSALSYDEIWKQMGKFTSLSIAKTVSQKALCFTSSFNVGQVDNIEIENDIVSVDNLSFTEGIGLIHQNVFSRVQSKMKIQHPACAVQIRLGGNKGVLSINPDLNGPPVLVRKSMQKFVSQDKNLEVVSISGHNQCFLNRQIITLLSGLGVPEQSFLELQQQQLSQMAEIFRDSKVAIELLSKSYKMESFGKYALTETFFCGLLRAIYKRQLDNLTKRARILVPEGQILLGVADPTNTLEYGKVFIKSSKIGIIQGKVVVCKNPCLHPGDVLILEAVDIPGLNYVDVIVFPSKGKRPHPNECSGSDLDGDRFFVTWREKLIPPQSFEPMKYPPKKAIKKEKGNPVNFADGVDFVLKYMTSGQLIGRISNGWLAHADKRGIFDERCLNFAEQFSIEVDSIKTGIHASIREADMPKSYPSFMQTNSNTYESVKVLGKLFEQCGVLGGVVDHIPSLEMDVTLVIDIDESDLKNATFLLNSYIRKIRRILRRFSISTEAEIITLSVDEFSSPWKRTHVQESAYLEWQQVRSEFERIFFDEYGSKDVACGPRDPGVAASLRRKASAWYKATYSYNWQESDERILSFAWIPVEILCTINSSQRQKSPTAEPLERLTYDVVQNFLEQKEHLVISYKKRLDLKKKLESCIKQDFPAANVILFGSSSLLVFDENSDVDICVLQWGTENPLATLEILLPSVEKFLGKCELIRAAVPIIRCEDFNGLRFDLSSTIEGVKKSVMVFQCIEKYPILLPLLYLLCQWGRVCGILQHATAASIIPTSSLIWLFVQYFTEKQKYTIPIPSLEDLMKRSDEDHFTSLTFVLDSIRTTELPQIADVFLEFFSHYGQINSTFDLRNPLNTRENILEISDPLQNSLRQKFLRAHHCLSYTGNISNFLTACMTSNRREIRLTPSASRFLNVDFVMQKISLTSGANIKFHRTKKQSIIFTISGQPSSVTIADREIQKVALHYQMLPPKLRSQKTFVQEATVVIFEGSLQGSDALQFHSYSGRRNPQHNYSSLDLPSPYKSFHSMEISRSKFEYALYRQLKLIKESHKVKTFGKMNAVIRFGTIYIVNLPKSLSEALTVTIETLETAIFQGLKSKNTKDEPKEKSSDELKPTLKTYTPPTTPKAKSYEAAPRISFTSHISEKMKSMMEKDANWSKEEEYYSISAMFDKELKFKLDSGFQLIKGKQRSLKWFSAYFVTQNEPNLRFCLETELPLSETDPIFKKLKQHSLLSKNDDGSIGINKDFKEIYMVRHKRVKSSYGRESSHGRNLKMQLAEISTTLAVGENPPSHFELEIKIPIPGDLNSSSDIDHFVNQFWEKGLELYSKARHFI